MVSLIVLAIFMGLPIDLTRHDFFNYNYLQLARISDGLVVCSAPDGHIAILDASGEQRASYESSGPGPTELEWPFLVMVDDNALRVLNRNRSFICIEIASGRIQSCLQPLSFPWIERTTGVYPLAPDKVMLMHTAVNRPTIHTLEADDKGQWTELERGFTVNWIEGTVYMDRDFLIHNGYVFETAMPLINGDVYTVKVFDCRAGIDEDAVQVLQARVPTIEATGEIHTFFRHCLKTDHGFAVVGSTSLNRRPRQVIRTFLDFFKEDGTLQARSFVDESTWLIPVLGSFEVMHLNRDTMILSPWPEPGPGQGQERTPKAPNPTDRP